MNAAGALGSLGIKSGAMVRCECSKAEEEAAAEEEKKRAHDEGVREIALRTQRRGPRWLK